jgi:hypothetical protein
MDKHGNPEREFLRPAAPRADPLSQLQLQQQQPSSLNTPFFYTQLKQQKGQLYECFFICLSIECLFFQVKVQFFL